VPPGLVPPGEVPPGEVPPGDEPDGAAAYTNTGFETVFPAGDMIVIGTVVGAPVAGVSARISVSFATKICDDLVMPK
jgi:hypothetical protein